MILKFALLCLAFTAVLSSEEHKARYPAASVPPPEVYAHSAARTNRLVHNFFHNIRMSWPLLDEIEQRQIENLGWKPTLVSYAYRANGTEVLINGTTGEDFLYMHRKMIDAVTKIAQEAGSPWIVDGWVACPDPAAPGDWPVPPVPESLSEFPDYVEYLEGYKTDEFYTNMIVPGQAYLNNDDNLRGLTLGELGVKLEYELHTYFHVRFSGYNPIGYRIQSAHPTAYIDPSWDDEDYDYLADFYSAHVNPTFWKIHGWIELQIEKWALANGLTSKDDVTWISTWEYGPLELFDELFQVAADAEAGVGRGGDNNAGEIVGAVLGAVAFGIAICLIGYYCIQKLPVSSSAKKIPESAKTHPEQQEEKPFKIKESQPQDEQVFNN